MLTPTRIASTSAEFDDEDILVDVNRQAQSCPLLPSAKKAFSYPNAPSKSTYRHRPHRDVLLSQLPHNTAVSPTSPHDGALPFTSPNNVSLLPSSHTNTHSTNPRARRRSPACSRRLALSSPTDTAHAPIKQETRSSLSSPASQPLICDLIDYTCRAHFSPRHAADHLPSPSHRRSVITID
jgi:hypothetical protein